MDDEQNLINIKDNLGDIADNINIGLRDFNIQFESVLGTTNILLGIISISLIAMVILKFLELKKLKNK